MNSTLQRNRQIAAILMGAAAILTVLSRNASAVEGVALEGSPGGTAPSIELRGELAEPPIAFAAQEVLQAAVAARWSGGRLVVELKVDPRELPPQGYRIERLPDRGALRVIGGDAVGAMYGGLDVAEAIRIGTWDALPEGDRRPYVERRGIKFNIPLDVRTPSYSDNGDSFQANIPEMWSMAFWRELFDAMARHRYNVLSLWNLHPFPSIVRVPEYPEIALDDVWRTRVKLDHTFSLTGSDMVRPEMLADVEVVRRMTIDEKIAFWREVMQRARDRGIEVYWFTWNTFVWGTNGKYGITAALDNPTTIAYFRASVRETVRTYPLLAGMGITAGEQMGGADAAAKEQWLWQTYGEGIRDALAEQPDRRFRLIHRFHQTGQAEILRWFKDYPGPFDFSFKYSIAHMYSMPDPPFLKPALAQMPPAMRTWLTVRNDDIYSFRWGDPDFARRYVLAMPPAERLAGFYMGPDGYCWGRDFLDVDPELPRPLVMDKHWYSFLLWGRLSYDPSLPDEHFQRILAARYPEVSAERLFDAWSTASKIIPQATRFFWGDIDLRWFPEACTRHPAPQGFYTVRHFILGQTMPGSGILAIADWLDQLERREPVNGITPPEVAEALAAHARRTLGLVEELRAAQSADRRELQRTLGDLEAMGHLGNYYAAKISGAVDLARFDRDGQPARRDAAVAHLSAALEHWKRYAAVAGAQYRPQLLNRIGYVDLRKMTGRVEEDIEIARRWKPGDLASSKRERSRGDVPFRP